ncbi:hypothetical protein GQ600_15617 [Phytophthora cactorum]|nr:hypothetical protein GQ600_15617 [Phytophthora cactorum]
MVDWGSVWPHGPPLGAWPVQTCSTRPATKMRLGRLVLATVVVLLSSRGTFAIEGKSIGLSSTHEERAGQNRRQGASSVRIKRWVKSMFSSSATQRLRLETAEHN